MAGRRVLILASGTRGDVEPAAALGSALKGRGLAVRFATHEPFRRLADEAALPYAPLPDNPTDILLRVCSALSLLGGPLAAVLDTRRYVRRARPMYAAIAAAALPLLREADAAVLGLPTVWLLPVALACGVLPICAFLQPLTRSSVEPSAIAPLLPPAGWVTTLGHRALEQAVWRPWRATLARWAEAAGLPLASRGPFAEIYRRRLPVLYGFSPLVVERPPDWPLEHVITGYWQGTAPARPVPPAVARFLERHPRPVYIGFGSRSAPYAGLARGLASVLAARGIAAVLQAPEAAPAASDLLLHVDGDLDHGALFPSLGLAIHHGGAGTFAAALRAGVPSVIVPGGVDSRYWQRRCLALGVGPRAPGLLRAAPDRLARTVEACLGDRGMRERAAAAAAALAAERGADLAAERIELLLRDRARAGRGRKPA